MARIEKKAFLEKPQRKPEKRKKQLGEGAEDSRIAKISFKRYLRQIEEELLDEEELAEEGPELPTSEEDIDILVNDFLDSDDELASLARGEPSPEDGAQWLLDRLRTHLIADMGFSTDTVDEWLESDAGNTAYEHFYNGIVT